MNLFILDNDLSKNVTYHCDKHVIKMILESAQMLSTAHRLLDDEIDESLYKSTHINHPCSKWVRENSSNYRWCFDYFIYLSNEYYYRFEKFHKTYLDLSGILESYPKHIIKSDFITTHPLAMPDEFKSDDVVNSYRKYYKNKSKTIKMSWKKREVPFFMMET